MSTVDSGDLVAMLLANLREACTSPDDPTFTWFGSNEADSGLLGVMKTIDAETASSIPTPGAKTIAAHASHAAFHLKASAAWLSGDKSAADWESSWLPMFVTDREWLGVQDEMSRQFAATVAAIESLQSWNRDALGGAIGAVAHAAYHLGAIRQILRELKAK
jgi:hypothetical protein